MSDFAFVNGGQAKVTIDSAGLLANAGFKVIFFAACGPIAPQLHHPRIDVICLNQFDILSDPQRWRAAFQGVWNRTAARRLKEVISTLDPRTTILHCHGYAKALSPSIGPILTNGLLPSVYTMHEYFLACPNGGFYDYQRNEICHRRALGASCLTTNCDARNSTQKAWRVLRQLATVGPGRIPGRLDNVIYISETQKMAMRPYLSERTHMYYVPNPIIKADCPRVNAELNDIFLFIGRLSPEKGGLAFAEASRLAGVRTVFVGDGAEADAIRKTNPNALVTGWQTPEQVQDWIGQARALVFPSLWYEGQPLVPLEALTRGVPVICGMWSAAAEAVIDGQNGVVYSEPTVAALVNAISRAKGINFRMNQPNVFDENAHLDRLVSVYNSIVSGTGE